MKKFIILVLSVLILFSLNITAVAEEDISAKAAIVYEPETGTVLYEKNSHDKMLIASTTKIITALVALENCSLDDVVKITRESVGVEGSSLYLAEGDEYTLEELLYGMMLESGNDAATAIGIHVSGSIAEFSKLMNEKARKIGCENTSFSNPHGLDGENHYSCASDLALIMAEAIKNQDFLKITSTKSITINGRTYENHNKLLSLYDGVISGKTGYTKSAGRILVSCAERDGMRLICVTLSDPDDWNDHMSLYDRFFSSYKLYRSPSKEKSVGEVTVISGTKESVSVSPKDETVLMLKSDDDVKSQIILPKFSYAQIKKGETVGQLIVTVNGKEKFRTELVFNESVPIDHTQLIGLKERIFRKIGQLLH